MKRKIEPPKRIFPLVTKDFFEWWDREVEPINKILKRGVEVYSQADGKSDWYTKCDPKHDYYKALLINIQPIEKDTPEKVLRDILRILDFKDYELELYDRAKKVLDAGKD